MPAASLRAACQRRGKPKRDWYSPTTPFTSISVIKTIAGENLAYEEELIERKPSILCFRSQLGKARRDVGFRHRRANKRKNGTRGNPRLGGSRAAVSCKRAAQRLCTGGYSSQAQAGLDRQQAGCLITCMQETSHLGARTISEHMH